MHWSLHGKVHMNAHNALRFFPVVTIHTPAIHFYSFDWIIFCVYSHTDTLKSTVFFYGGLWLILHNINLWLLHFKTPKGLTAPGAATALKFAAHLFDSLRGAILHHDHADFYTCVHHPEELYLFYLAFYFYYGHIIQQEPHVKIKCFKAEK